MAVALGLLGATAATPLGVPDGARHEGAEVVCDLPDALRVRNTVGTDGQGLCVWASTEMAARYQNCTPLIGIFQQMQHERGGGWPDRVDAVMRKYAPEYRYRQYLGPDIEFIREGLASGRPVCVTYGYGELYGMKTIAHMVLCVGMDDRWAAILDNNDEHRIWWMPIAEFKRRFGWPTGNGWAWYTLAPVPPPVPHN